MFSHQPLLIAEYRNHRIEVRLMHHPMGVLVDLKIYGSDEITLVVEMRNGVLYRDCELATVQARANALKLIDQLLPEGQAID